MPPVRNVHYVNVDDHTTSPIHLGSNQVIETKMPMHLQQSPNTASSASVAAAASAASAVSKQCNQYGSPSVQHPSGSHQQAIQQTPLTKAELRKVITIKSLTNSHYPIKIFKQK